MTTPAPSEAAQKLTAFMNRMDNLLDTLDAAKEDVKNLKDEIKSDGFNVRAFTKAVKMRRDERARDDAAGTAECPRHGRQPAEERRHRRERQRALVHQRDGGVRRHLHD